MRIAYLEIVSCLNREIHVCLIRLIWNFTTESKENKKVLGLAFKFLKITVRSCQFWTCEMSIERSWKVEFGFFCNWDWKKLFIKLLRLLNFVYIDAVALWDSMVVMYWTWPGALMTDIWQVVVSTILSLSGIVQVQSILYFSWVPN